MYRVLYYRNHADKRPVVIHEPVGSGEKLLSGNIIEELNAVGVMEFSIGLGNIIYGQVEPITGMVQVINSFDGAEVFYGRILKPKGEMSQKGLFSQRYIAEDSMSYFNDSTQPYMKIANNGLLDFFTKIINNHNAQVEPHKRFKIGAVTMTTDTDLPYRYIGYKTTFETLRESVINQIGGYLRIRRTANGMYIDWLKTIGRASNSPIELGVNIKSATRETSFENVITRLVPLGADLGIEDPDAENDRGNSIKERLTISTVNGGKLYLEDRELLTKFGIIQKPMDWAEIDDATILKQRGQQFLDSQKAILTTWEVDAIERSLIDSRFEKYEVGNSHPIINAPMSGVERLQIIEKTTDLLNPQAVKLKIGANQTSLSAYYNQVREAQKSIENVIRPQPTIPELPPEEPIA